MQQELISQLELEVGNYKEEYDDLQVVKKKYAQLIAELTTLKENNEWKHKIIESSSNSSFLVSNHLYLK